NVNRIRRPRAQFGKDGPARCRMPYFAKSLEYALLIEALRVPIKPIEFIDGAFSRARRPQRRIPIPPVLAVRITSDDVRRRRKRRRFDCSGDENRIRPGQARPPAQTRLSSVARKRRQVQPHRRYLQSRPRRRLPAMTDGGRTSALRPD